MSSPAPIRVSADPLTYPLHIILRFELELALIEGSSPSPTSPSAWREGMRRLLGVEVPSDALGCLQDVHWGAGSFGYFPSYALGCLIAAQLWEALEAELGPREEDLRTRRGGADPGAGSPSACTATAGAWTRSRWSSGRPGDALEIEPFLRYVAPLAGG